VHELALFDGAHAELRELALFAGAGGGILGGHLLGWRTVCAVEWEPYAAAVLCARQNDGLLPAFPIWDDVRTFDGRPWRGLVDVVSGGFPCQDISVAGKGAGIDGERSGMWAHMARIVGEVRPRHVFVENSPAIVTRGLGRVLGDLAALGYDCRWTVLGAADVGAPHQRDRFWLVAHASGERHELAEQAIRTGRNAFVSSGEDVAYAYGLRQLQQSGADAEERRRTGNGGEDVGDACTSGLQAPRTQPLRAHGRDSGRMLATASWWRTEPDVGRVADVLAHRLGLFGANE
jgi:DNA (cytosine-5)-methyltransferase 1